MYKINVHNDATLYTNNQKFEIKKCQVPCVKELHEIQRSYNRT